MKALAFLYYSQKLWSGAFAVEVGIDSDTEL